MTGIIVKIIAAVLSFLAIATKQMKQGRTGELYWSHLTEIFPERCLKKLIGNTDVEDVLRKSDKLTQEVRMAAAELLKITNRVDSKMRRESTGYEQQYRRCQQDGVTMDRVRDVCDEVQGINNTVRVIDENVQDVRYRVQGVDEWNNSTDRPLLFLPFFLPNPHTSQGTSYEIAFYVGFLLQIHPQMDAHWFLPVDLWKTYIHVGT